MKQLLTDNQLEMLRNIYDKGLRRHSNTGIFYVYVKSNRHASTATANQLHKKGMIEIDNNGGVTITDLGKQQLI